MLELLLTKATSDAVDAEEREFVKCLSFWSMGMPDDKRSGG